MPAVHSNLSKISFSLSLSLLKLSLHQIFYCTCVQTTNDANTRNYHRIQPYGNTTLEKFLLFTHTNIFLIHCKTLENWDLRKTMPTTELCVLLWNMKQFQMIDHRIFRLLHSIWMIYSANDIFNSVHCIVNNVSMPTHCSIEHNLSSFSIFRKKQPQNTTLVPLFKIIYLLRILWQWQFWETLA